MTGYQSKKAMARDKLAQPEQEPVAWKHPDKNMVFWKDTKEMDEYHGFKPTIPLYAAPPQRPWVGLTDEEFQLIYDMGRTPTGMMEMVEAKLKEKNNG